VATAKLLPTEYLGSLTMGDRPPQEVYAPTSMTTYVIMGSIALAIYLGAARTASKWLFSGAAARAR
jgi:hypothetical protein